ncbi:tellurium resistance protein [Candidatus Riflebacteria bacterium]
MAKRPGGQLAARPLHFFWLADCSGSMQSDGKIQSLNQAIREAIPHMKKVAEDNPNASVLVRALAFGEKAFWHLKEPTPVMQFSWKDLSAAGVTAMGEALELLAEQLQIPPMDERALPPVLVLISDGLPTDDFQSGINTLMALPWGRKAVRIAVAIGSDANLPILQKFIGNTGLKPMQANNTEALSKHIRWASTAVLKAASSPHSQSKEEDGFVGINVLIQTPFEEDFSVGDVW